MLEFILFVLEEILTPIIMLFRGIYLYLKNNFKFDIHSLIGIIVLFLFFQALTGHIDYFVNFSKGIAINAKYSGNNTGAIFIPIVIAVWILLFKRGALLLIAYPLIAIEWFLMLQF